MIMEIIRVAVGGYQHLIVGKLPSGKLYADLVNLLRCQVGVLREGLNELEELLPVCLSVLLLGGHHFKISSVGAAVKPRYQTLPIVGGFSFVNGVEHGTQ